jgi:uncharacterized protein (TIGR02996 family)
VVTIEGDGAALLAAVRACPDDDLPRLVFADWLDEHGTPDWAEFIRTQVRAAAETDPAVQTALARHANALARDGRHWDAAFGAGLPPHSFRRGMPERLRVHGEPTPADRAVLGRYPVRDLWLMGTAHDHPNRDAHRGWLPALLAELPGGPVRELAVAGYAVGDEDLAAVAGVMQLEGLTLWCRHLRPGVLVHLRRLALLRHLSLVGGGVRAADLADVAAIPGLTGLEVADTPFTAPAFRRLLAAPALRSVRTDGPGELDLTDEDVRGLVGSALDTPTKLEFLSRAGRFDLVLRLAREAGPAYVRGPRPLVRAGTR